jgi:hypothetical protein
MGAERRGRAPGRAAVRLAVIEGFAGRRSVIPFAILVMALLGAGLVVLLLLNTAVDRDAFRLQTAQKRQSELTDQQQALELQLSAHSAPGALASEASALGMVPDPRPVFLNPSNGAVLGVPTSAPMAAVPAPAASPSASPSPSASAAPSVGQASAANPSASPSAAGQAQ